MGEILSKYYGLFFKIVAGSMDSMVSCNFINSSSVTMGNRYKLTQKLVHYFSFTNRIVSIWIRLPDYVVSACSGGVFAKRLDFFWRNQDCVHN